MIQVCDSIMGSGKSSAAITYMNEHPNMKFIYITPYLEEAKRIKEGCPKKRFVEPSNKINEYHFKKCEHTASLIKQGRNIATTHQMFKMYTTEMLEDIRRHRYKLIIDESINALEKFCYNPDDIQIAVDAGYVKEENGVYSLIRDGYRGTLFRELFRFLSARDLIRMENIDEKTVEHLFYWLFPPELLTAFQDVFILTYLFKGQDLHHFLEMYHLPYRYIGVRKEEDGTFRFCDKPGYTPDYTSHLGELIHIVESEKMNQVGDGYHALSMNWYANCGDELDRLKKNIYNCVNNIWRDVPAREKMWGCYKDHHAKIRGGGYTKSFVTFNARATNQYRDKHYLVYAVNIFMNATEKNFYVQNGIHVDQDVYALSTMLQWIWRSAIRDGDEIYLYIPSRRMRELLTNWIKTTSEGVTESEQ